MRAKYCCDSRLYEKYYADQVGGGAMPYFSGSRYQRGYGLGNIFGSIAKSVLPLLKSGAKTVGKQLLHLEIGFASDLLEGKNAKDAALSRAKRAGSKLLQTAKRKATGNPQPAKRRKTKVQKKRRNRDIFT